MTDATGAYRLDLPAAPDAFGQVLAHVNAETPEREPYFDYLAFPALDGRGSKDVHLYRIKQITAGESTLITVVSGDATCGLSDELTCRRVHVVVPADGMLSLGCANPALTIIAVVKNDGLVKVWPHAVTAGAEVIADIGMRYTPATSQSCRFETSLAR